MDAIIDNLLLGFRILAPLLLLWWLYLPIILGFFAWSQFRTLKKAEYISGMAWVNLEIRIPKDPHRSPKAMEQIFAGLHAATTNIKSREAIFKGKVPDWFCFEIVSTEGRIGFFIRVPEQYRNLIESQIYAQYPELEIAEAEDYTRHLPEKLPDDNYDLWGANIILTKEDAYPIRTYEEFEEKVAGKEDIKRVDTMASMAELLSTLKNGEHMWVQLLVRPADDTWQKNAQTTIDKLMGKTPKEPPPGVLFQFTNSLIDFLTPGEPAPITAPREEKRADLSPGKQDVLKSIEKSLNKLGHETTIRFVYIAPKITFKRAHVAGMVGVFKQFSSQNLNGFKVDKETAPSGKWPFKKRQEFSKKVEIYKKFKNRAFSAKPYVLNTEELATVYHFPDIAVRSPLLPRVEAKKGEPPTNLPISQ